MLPNEQNSFDQAIAQEEVDIASGVVDLTVEDTPSSAGLDEMPLLGAASNPELDRHKALKAAFLQNYIDGTPVTQGYKNNIGELDKDGRLGQLTAEKAEEDSASIIGALEELYTADPDVDFESAQAAAEMKAVVDTQAQELDSTAAYVDAIAGPDATPDQRAAATNQLKLYEMFAEAMGEFSTGDKVMDFGAEMIPFVSTLREFSLTGDIFGNEENMRSAIVKFKSLPMEQQQEMFPYIQEHVLDKLGPIRGFPTLEKFINPVGDDDLSDFSNWWKLIDAVDLTSAGAAFALAVRSFKSTINLPKTMKAVGNEDDAGEAVATALVSDESAEAMNLSKETAFGDAVAFDISLLDPAYTAGISSKAQESLRTFFGNTDKTIDDIMAGNSFMKEGILNSVERGLQEQAAYKKFKAAEHENITVVNRAENTTTFSYQARDENGELYNETYDLDLTLDNVGQWKQSEIATLSAFLSSPTVFAKGLTKLDVKTATRLDSTQAKLFRELTDLQTEAVKDLGSLLRPKNRKKLAEVEHVLREGDEFPNADGTRGTVFDVDTLKGAYHLDDAQISTYYKTNRLYNNLWRLRNNTKRQEMIARKYKQVRFNEQSYSFGKRNETANDAYNSLTSGNIAKAWDAVDGEVTTSLSRDALDEQYAMGKVMVKLPEAYSPDGTSGKFSHVLVNAEDIHELPSVVLNRKRGYVPRVSENGHWFVKEFADDVVDGKETTTVARTLRYFDNKKDAETFREQQIVKDMEDNGTTRLQAEGKFKSLEDREEEITNSAAGSFSHGSGGLYTAARAQDEILFGLEGERSQRVSPYQALVRNIANVSRQVPINQWRLGLEQRWINTAKALTGKDIDKFGTLPDSIESTRSGEFLNKMARQIRDWQGFPSKEEQVYQGATQRLYEWALGKNSESGARIAGWMRDKDPIAASRAAAFHSLLGWFNPAQLWVQAQGMSIAVSMNLGKNLTETLRHTTGLAVLGLGRELPKGSYKNAAKVAGMDAKEFEELHKLWIRTGFEDSILQTADHAAAIRGHGIAMDAVSKAADKGLLFYRHGELLNRRMSFTSALDDLKAGRLEGFENFKKGSKVNDAELKAVMDRANVLMLNMTKANRAQWQKGLASIPTQFFQVSAKALETVGGFNDSLTGAERMRILAGQVALYGTAGVPLVNFASNYLMEVADVTQQDIDNNPVLVKTWNDGFWGFTTLGIFGVDAEVSSRGSLIRGVTDFVDNWMFSEDTVAIKLMGAFGATGQRFWDSFIHQIKPLMYQATPIDAIDVLKIPTMPFLETVSTWRNGEKAVFMQVMDRILTNSGDTLIGREFDVRESIMKAIGFQLSDEAKIYKLNEMTENAKAVRQKIADMLIHRMNDAVFKSRTGQWSDAKQAQHEQQMATMFAGLDPDEKVAVQEAVQRRLMSDTKEAKSLRRYIQTIGTDMTEGITKLSAVLGTNVQTINEPEED